MTAVFETEVHPDGPVPHRGAQKMLVIRRLWFALIWRRKKSVNIKAAYAVLPIIPFHEILCEIIIEFK